MNSRRATYAPLALLLTACLLFGSLGNISSSADEPAIWFSVKGNTVMPEISRLLASDAMRLGLRLQ